MVAVRLTTTRLLGGARTSRRDATEIMMRRDRTSGTGSRRSVKTRLLSEGKGVGAACLLTLLAATGLAHRTAAQAPLPEAIVPEMPAFPAVVITAGGQRLLLEHTDARIEYNAATGLFESNKPGWWFINYPVERIDNLPAVSTWQEWITMETGRPAEEVKNWYFHAKGDVPPEPAAPTGPAPIIPTPNPTRVVNQEHPQASDENPGSMDAPFATIGRALSGAGAGDIIHVYPGTYRESLSLTQQATKDKPLRIEGIRGPSGRMPIITGNNLLPASSWVPVSGLSGVYRAPVPAGFTMGTASVNLNGRNLTLVERSYPDALGEGEYAFNRGSHRLLESIPLDPMPKAGDSTAGRSWHRVVADSEGYVDLGAHYGSAAANGIIWAVAHVWLDPLDPNVVWDPRYPAPITGKTKVDGPFRAGRMSGLSREQQVNPYRIWLNGSRLETRLSALDPERYAALPRVTFDYGTSDTWNNFQMREGWNTIVLQLDTSQRTSGLRLRFRTPNDRPAIASANPPDSATRPNGTERSFVSEFLILEPEPAGALDYGIYVRLPGSVDPRQHEVDLAARGAPLVNIGGRHIHVKGFEIRHGSNYMQKGTVSIAGPANRLEGSSVHSGENRGVNLSPKIDPDGPLVVRNNWIFNHGQLGVGGDGRGGAIVDYNVIADNNWGAYERLWESGGIKLFRMTGTTLRHNEVRGVGGPGIWLDWENFQNRVDGNFTHGHWGFGVGVEASPGPNLIANNLSVDMAPGSQWFRAHVLVWDSIRTWSAYNTTNGVGRTGNFWNGTEGNRGLSTQNVTNRGSQFEPFPSDRDTRYFNNIAIGSEDALLLRSEDARGGNYTDYGKGATAAPLTTPQEPRNFGAYRPAALGTANLETVADSSLVHIRHDFHGLLRFQEDRGAPGAFRIPPRLPAEARGVLEVEFSDLDAHRVFLETVTETSPSPDFSQPPPEVNRLDSSSREIRWSRWPEVSQIIVERSVNLEDWTTLGTFAADAGSMIDRTAPLGALHYYRIVGRTAEGVTVSGLTVGRFLADWHHVHFGSHETMNTTAESVVWGDAADPDGDRIPVLMEYYLDLDPWSPDGSGWSTHQVGAETMRLSYSRARWAPDVVSRVVWSSDLITWTTEGIAIEVKPDGQDREIVEATLPRGDKSTVFMRVEVFRREEAPPAPSTSSADEPTA